MSSSNSSTTCTGGAYLARMLKNQGVSHIFFVDAILRHMLAHAEQLGIERVLAHSEKGAAYMADGFARAARQPAVCMAQSVGAANLAAGLQDAHFAHSPVIALTGRHEPANQYRHAYQELPHQPLFAEVTKFSARVETPSQYGPLVRQAFRVAASGQTGPVHLDVAGNVGIVADQWRMDAAPAAAPVQEVPAHRPLPEPRRLAALCAAISEARTPVFVIGDGVCWSGAEAELRRLARHADIPVVCGLDAKAVMAGEDRLDMGVTGTYGTDAANHLMSMADFVLFIGCEVSDQLSCNWKLPARNTRSGHIGLDAEDLGLNLDADCIALQADPRAAIEALCSELPACRRDEWIAKAHALRDQWWEAHAGHLQSTATPLRPERLCAELGTWLPTDAIVVADTGYASQWSGQFLRLRDPNQRFLRAAGSLGWAFPASLGVKAACPERPVVCLTGDGGFMYHLPELETALRRGLHTITVVNNNGCLAQGLKNLRLQQIPGGRRMEDCFQFVQQDFVAIAQAFGCTGLLARTPSELSDALARALQAKGPVVIDVRTDPQALAPIPWMPS